MSSTPFDSTEILKPSFDQPRCCDVNRIALTAFSLATLVFVPGGIRRGAADEPALKRQLEFFESQVRPLLAQHCYECHSVGAKRLEANLLLDSRKGHLEGGDSGAAVVPGVPDDSLLIDAIRYESYEMPPKGKLPQNDIDTLTRWVKMGAPWPKEKAPEADTNAELFDLEKRRSEFWVWQPIVDHPAPAVANSVWPRNDIDRYIYARLAKVGLKPTADAARTALLRRVYFDLIGLPPTTEDVSAFLNDTTENALESVVDRLLESEHFGERWGRHWLDLVRYAESRGHEFDNDTPNAFQYRDYVIRALNADIPYDQFVTEHIAGDLLSSPRLHPKKGFNESVLATGFWFLGEWVHSPVDIRKDESDRFDNMIDVASKTFLGVTVACARCHDHKFDAISTADYYSLSGFLQSSDYRQVRFESMEQNRQVAKQLAAVDDRYQRQITEFLESHNVYRPRQASYLQDEAIVVDYGRLAQKEFRQDGFVFGLSPQVAGRAYLDSSSGEVKVAKFGAAASDPAWSGLESVTEGAVQNRSAISKLPKSGRTLRSPTFDLTHGTVGCLVEGSGHIVACVDSHRLVAGPLHKQTIRSVKEGDRKIILNLDRYVGHRLHLEFIPAVDARLSVRMVTQGLEGKELTELERRLTALDQSYIAYAEAAEALLNHDRQINYEERVFADFENGTYEGWTVTGEAFGSIPQTQQTVASYQGAMNGRGKFFVNSHNIRPGGDVRRGDSLTGTMTSSEFIIDFDTVEFLVGGGAHKNKTCVNLVIDGENALSATGKANNRMSLKTWDVRRFAGRTARIQIVDDHSGGWGNIGIDHIVFRKTKPVDPDPADDNTVGDATRPFLTPESAQAVQGLIRAWQSDREQVSSQIVRRSRVALAMMDGTGEDDRVLIRGNSSKPGRKESRHFLTAVSGDAPMKIRTGSGRLELARQINDRHNPLTARVIVNRIWHHLLGRGIVATVDDFGFLGQRPSHPQLLDHLATRFLDDGQSIKRMIRYIVLSRTYQMSSLADSAAAEADPGNRLWHYRPPRRLEGEAIRDSLLAVSGRLDPTQFGPPVPIHLTSFMDGRGRPGKSGPLDGQGRRSIYISVRRNFLSPFMLTFDTPVPFSSMGRRNVSNVPAQALILLNDPLVTELCNDWGRRAIRQIPGKSAAALSQRIEWMYVSGFGRQPTPEERETTAGFLTSQAGRKGLATDDPTIWASFAHILANTKEFIFLR